MLNQLSFALVVAGTFSFLLLIRFGSQKIAYYSLVLAFFLPGLLLNAFFGGQSIGVSGGGTPLYNILQILILSLFLGIAYFNFHNPTLKVIKERRPFSAKQNFTILTFIGLFLLAEIESATANTKIIPIILTLLFLIPVQLATVLDFGILCQVLRRVWLIFGILTFVSFFLNLPVTNSSEALMQIDSNVYICPFNSAFGLPVHIGGLMSNGKNLGLFCLFGVCLSLFTEIDSKLRMFNFSIFFVFLGSFSGDRTFYSLTTISIILKLFLSGTKTVNKSKVIILSTVITATAYVLYSVILPLFSDVRNIKLVGGRTLLWSTILSDWNKTSLFGHGPNTMADYMYLHTGQISYGNAHNSFLQYLWDYGLLGIFFYSAFILCLIIVISTKVNNVRQIPFMLIFLSYQGDNHLSLNYSILGLYLILLLTAVFERDEKDVSNPGQAIVQKGWR